MEAMNYLSSLKSPFHVRTSRNSHVHVSYTYMCIQAHGHACMPRFPGIRPTPSGCPRWPSGACKVRLRPASHRLFVEIHVMNGRSCSFWTPLVKIPCMSALCKHPPPHKKINSLPVATTMRTLSSLKGPLLICVCARVIERDSPHLGALSRAPPKAEANGGGASPKVMIPHSTRKHRPMNKLGLQHMGST